jgi:hypothetical protein
MNACNYFTTILLTGSKMRLMFKLIDKVGKQSSLTLKKQFASGGSNEFEFKTEFARKFTIDSIASCAFGLDVSNEYSYSISI